MDRNEHCWYKEVCDKESCSLCVKFLEMNYLMTHSNLPLAKQKAIKMQIPDQDRDAYKRLTEIKHDIDNFVYQGKNLYIGSDRTGTGKTSWAIKLMHNFFNQIWDGNGLRERALFVHVPTFLMKCKEFNETDKDFAKLKKLLLSVDLVVWDDIASTDMSGYDLAQLEPFIDFRLLSELSNIFTCNYSDRAKLSKVIGERLTSRVWSNHTEVIIFRGGDLR